MRVVNTTYSINIQEDVESPEVLAELLRSIADLIDEGYQSGYYPTWDITRNEEDENQG